MKYVKLQLLLLPSAYPELIQTGTQIQTDTRIRLISRYEYETCTERTHIIFN